MLRVRNIIVVIACFAAMLLASGASAQRTVKWIPDLYNQPIYEPLTAELISKFNQLHPEIEVEVMAGVSEDEFKILVSTGLGPDVSHAVWDYSELALSGFLEPIEEDLLRLNVDLRNDFYPNAMRQFEWEGKYYGFRTQTDIRGLMWEQGVFEEAGLDAEAGPQDWEEFEEYITRLTTTQADGSLKRVGFVPWDGNWGYWAGSLFTFGDDYWNFEGGRPSFDNPKNLDAMEWVHSFVQRYGTPGQLDAQGVRPAWWGENAANFLETHGMFVMHDFWPKQLSDVGAPFRINARPLVYPEGGRNGTVAYGSGYVIPANAPNPTEARLLLAFLASKEAQEIFVRHCGCLSARTDVIDVYFDVFTPIQLQLMEQIEVANTARPFDGVLRQALDPEFTRMLNNEITPAEALTNAQRTAVARLTEMGVVARGN